MTAILKRMWNAIVGPVAPEPAEIAPPAGGYTDTQLDAIRVGLATPAPGAVSYCDHPDCMAKTWYVAVVPSRTAQGGWTHLVLEDRHQAQPWHETRNEV